ncbi:MAG: T9SS type A sorting domain-containing protein [Lewinellaceae bacterium]|nr:T9SS type A sorting domain-containing protein [Lewinellaceae bacterium]
MFKKTTLFLLLLALAAALPAQELVSYTLIGSKSQAQLAAQFNLPFIQFGARYYKVTYSSHDLTGVQDTLSGFVVVPDNNSKIYPRLVYQHGTSSSKDNVPSSYGQPGGEEGDIPVFFAGMGFVSLAPDYLGLGISKGFHPYVHAESETWVALDMLRAFDSLQTQIDVHTNEQLFLTGYSQGGHASMALHHAVETDPNAEFTATAASHMSGPYSIGEVMRDFILSDSVYFYPAYIPNTLLSYQVVYGNLFDQVEDVFRAPYADPIGQFFTGQLNLGDLNNLLINQLIATEGECRPTRMIQDSIKQVVASDPDHPVNIALRANDVYKWAPQAPTRLFYCKADDQVPYLNSLVARDTMLALGAVDLAAANPDSTATHVECVEPAVISTLAFFLGYQQIGEVSYTGESQVDAGLFSVQPNPADTYVEVHTGREGELLVYDITGRLVAQRAVSGDVLEMAVGDWEKGVYLFVWRHGGRVEVDRVVIR